MDCGLEMDICLWLLHCLLVKYLIFSCIHDSSWEFWTWKTPRLTNILRIFSLVNYLFKVKYYILSSEALCFHFTSFTFHKCRYSQAIICLSHWCSWQYCYRATISSSKCWFPWRKSLKNTSKCPRKRFNSIGYPKILSNCKNCLFTKANKKVFDCFMDW